MRNKLQSVWLKIISNDRLRFLLAMACLTLAVIVTVELIRDVNTLLATW